MVDAIGKSNIIGVLSQAEVSGIIDIGLSRYECS